MKTEDTTDTPSTKPKAQNPVLSALLIAAVACIAYSPVFHAGFIWDDDAMLTNNPLVRDPSGLYRIWFTREPIDYWPITGSSLWLEWRLWGLDATGYHVTNVVLHVISSVTLWQVLRRLSVHGAVLAAVLFAVHPVNVESVAWIAQRKNTLSLVFFLVSLLWYLKSDRPVWYWLSVLAFALSMLAKGSTATLPAILLLLEWWRHRRFGLDTVMRVAPFIAIAALLTLVNFWFQAQSAGPIRDVTWLERALGAGAVVWFYLYKAFLPINLMFVYGTWEIRATDPRWWLPLSAAVAMTSLLIWQRRRPVIRALLLAWGFFVLALIPVMGLTDVYFMRYSLVADHYQYVAVLAVVSAIAAAIAAAPPALSRVVGAALVVLLGVATWRQAHLYADAETIYLATVRDNPHAWMVHNNLANLYAHRAPPEYTLAEEHLRAAIAVRPQEAPLHDNLGTTLFAMSRFEEALAAHREAVRLDPAAPIARVGLADDLLALRRYEEAVEAYRQALDRTPDAASTRWSYGMALQAIGRDDQAVLQFEQAGRQDPRAVRNPALAGDSLLQLGRVPEAIGQYEAAYQRDPRSEHTLQNLGYALMLDGRLDEAEARLTEAIRLNPDSAAAHNNLGNVFLKMDRVPDAVREFTVALRHGKGSEVATTHNDLAVALARQGRRNEAIVHLQDALRLRPEFEAARKNLATLSRVK